MIQLLRASDVMAMLKISRSQAYTPMRDPEPPTVRLGKCVRVDEQDLREFIEKQKTGRGVKLKDVRDGFPFSRE